MVGKGSDRLRPGHLAISTFTMQMAAVRRSGEPDVFLFTAMSAIPVADTVRAFYEHLGITLPNMAAIHLNHKKAYRSDDVIQESDLSDEVTRLEPILRGAHHACVVEQNVITGRTLQAAQIVLETLGIQQVSTFIRSNWYRQAARHEIDEQSLTSEHVNHMRTIGVVAAETTMVMN